jgi:hypothetical protein
MKKSKEQIFWDWFIKNADLYFSFEGNQKVLFSRLKAELNKIHPDIVFEFSPILENGTREFVISADGIKSTFPIVTTLVKQAPELKEWKIVAFRQPHKNVNQVNYQNLTINFDDVFFRYAKDNGKIGLELNIRGYLDSPEWSTAVFILLDNILGEFDTEMILSYINKQELKEDEVNTLFPITALPNVIQDCKSEIYN